MNRIVVNHFYFLNILPARAVKGIVLFIQNVVDVEFYSLGIERLSIRKLHALSNLGTYMPGSTVKTIPG